jgi:hypothetical protein
VPDGVWQYESRPQKESVKETILEYQLDKSQLAFTIVERQIMDGQLVLAIFHETTAFSKEMIESTSSPASKTIDQYMTDSAQTLDMNYRVDHYAPRYGFCTGNEEVIIIMKGEVGKKKTDGQF